PCDSSLHASRAYRIPTAAALEAVVMGKPRVKPNYRRRVLRFAPSQPTALLGGTTEASAGRSRRQPDFRIQSPSAAVANTAFLLFTANKKRNVGKDLCFNNGYLDREATA